MTTTMTAVNADGGCEYVPTSLCDRAREKRAKCAGGYGERWASKQLFIIKRFDEEGSKEKDSTSIIKLASSIMKLGSLMVQVQL